MAEEKKYALTHPWKNLLLILIGTFFVANLIPSGEYAREVVNGRTLVDPTSFQFVAKQYVGISDFFESFYKGFVATASLVGLILFVGGAFGVANHIKLMEVALKQFYKKIKNLPFPAFVVLFTLAYGLLISFTGSYDLCIVFIPLIVPLCLTMGYDVLTGAAVTLVAACIGYGAAMANPYFTGTAHMIAELPIFSAMWFRGICFLILIVPCTWYISRYAKRVKADPTKSYVYGMDLGFDAIDPEDDSKFTPALIRAGIVFLAGFAVMIAGSVKFSFSYSQIAATFAAMGFLTGLAYGLKLNELCYAMANGMQNMFMASTVMLFARGILYLLEQSSTVDTIIMFLAQFIEGSTYVSTTIMFFVQSIINAIIPSASGQAMVTMPMMVPLADMAGINRQVAALASQFGDGYSNFLWPTNGTLLAMIAASKLPYSAWAKFFVPLFFIISAFSIVFLWVAIAIDLGPF